jgi:hypothetical protein
VQKYGQKKFVSFFPELDAPTEGKRCSGHFIKGAFPSGQNFIFEAISTF